MEKSFFVYNFGCRVNLAETLGIRKQMLEVGFTESKDNPDLIIINSCAVTRKAEKEALQFIRRKRREFPAVRIIVTGCAGTKWKKEDRIIPEVEIFTDKEKIREKIREIGPSTSLRVKENIYEESGRALIKIQDGCDRFCSYCIVPYLRGKSKSKKTEDIVGEIRPFDSAQGKEVILTAINTDLYGKDTGETLVDLAKQILDKTEIERLSFGSINPDSINTSLIELFKSDRLIKFIHLPIQSGSNKILGLMNRGYKREEIKGKLEEIKKQSKLALIGTDIIVGFPGETEEDFQQTYKFLAQSPISKFHIFRFSKREGTAAWNLENKLGTVPESVKKARAKALEGLGNKKYQIFLEKHIGKTFKALFLVRKIGEYQEALLENNVPTWIKTKKDLRGQIKRIRINKLTKERLWGELS